MNTSSRLITLAAVAACLAGGRTLAANKYWTGTGIWNTTNANWGTVTGGPYTSTWSNGAPDAAIFEGPAGSVTLAMTGTANGMTFSTTGYTVTGGTLVIGAANMLAAAGRIVVASGATLDATAAGLAVGGVQKLLGSGTVAGGFTIAGGATLSPGNSPGTLSVTGSTLWGGGGNSNWQIDTTAGGAGTGTGWDLLDSTGALDITASGGNPFSIDLWSLSGLSPDTNGSVSDFNAASSYNFRIAEFDGGITGFDVSKFSVNTAALNGTGGFTNEIAGQGTFFIALGDTVLGGNPNQPYLVYTPGVPEPGTLALAGIGLGRASAPRRDHGVTSRHVSVASSRR